MRIWKQTWALRRRQCVSCGARFTMRKSSGSRLHYTNLHYCTGCRVWVREFVRRHEAEVKA